MKKEIVKSIKFQICRSLSVELIKSQNINNMQLCIKEDERNVDDDEVNEEK